MSDATDSDTTTVVNNDAIPTSVVATPVTAAGTDPATIISSIPSSISSSVAALTSPITPTTFATSSIQRSSTTSSSHSFTELPPFLTGTGTRPPFATSSAPPFFGDTSNGLSTGAKVGIGVGVAALALSIVAVALLILRMRKKEQELGVANGPPPPYEEAGASNTNVVEMRPKPAREDVAALNTGEASENSPVIAPAASRSTNRKSKASIRPRRNSNLARVPEEEAESSRPNLAFVSEGDDGASTTAPRTPRTPRTAALYALTGESDGTSPTRSSFLLDSAPPLLGSNASPVSSDYNKKLSKGGR